MDAQQRQKPKTNAMSGKNWLLHIPRFPDNLPWGLLELRNIFEKNNIHCDIIDINHEIYKSFFNTPFWVSIDSFGVMNRGKIPLYKIARLFNRTLNCVKPKDNVFLSVFSTESRSWALLFAVLLRKWFDVKIFMGGAGIYAPGESEHESEWADYILRLNLADAIFLNHTDETMQQAIDCNFNIQGKIFKESATYPKLGHLPVHITQDPIEEKRVYDSIYYREDLEHPALQDDLLGIEWAFKIHSTLGCVKRCTFCDVPVTQRWVMRDAEEVVAEVKYYYETTGRTHFFMGDSTCNGSTSQWMKVLEGLYKLQQQIGKPIYWNSQFAIKPHNRVSEEQIELMAATNFMCSVGMDHPSDSVLHHMRKKYTWEDCLWHIDMFEKYNVWIRDCLWITGYPTETEQDFEEYNKLFDRLKHSHTFVSNIANVCYINRNSPLLEIVDIDWHNPNYWTSGELTHSMRLQRKRILDDQFAQVGKQKYKYIDSYRRAMR